MGDSEQRGTSRGAWSVVSLVVIAGLQVGWLGWWLRESLPNSTILGGVLYRGFLVSRLIPQVVPGVTFAQSGVGQIAEDLRHVENLTQRGPIVLAASLILLAGLGLGDGILRGLRLRGALGWRERIPLEFGLGMIALATLTLGLGRFGLLHQGGVRAGLATLALWGIVSQTRPKRSETTLRTRPVSIVAFILVTGPFLVLMALAAMIPTIDFDALEYHVQGPKEYYQDGRIAFHAHNVYTSMPFGVEMLHLLGMVVLGDWWRGALVGQLLVMLHAPMAAAMIGMAASRFSSPRAGWFAAVAYLTTPWIFRLAALPYVEGPMCFYHAALIYTASRADSPRWWGVVGGLAGGAMACKYPALISAVIPFGLWALWTRCPRNVLAFAIGVGVVIGPWLAKNLIDTGNPVYPLANGIFHGTPWSEAREAKWQNAHGAKPPTWAALRDGILDVAGRSDWQSGLYTMLIPLALLHRAARAYTKRLLGYSIYIFATWFFLTHRLDRFWLPILVPMAILAGIGADAVRCRWWGIWLGFVLFLVTLTNFSYAISPLTAFNEWTGDLTTMRTSLPRLLNSSLATIDETLPPDAKPLLIGQAAVFHMQHPIVFNTVFDDEIFETIARGRTPEEVRLALRQRGVTHVYVDWQEIERHRKPGGYGFTDFITPSLFEELARQGVLAPMPPPGPDRQLYRMIVE